MGFSTFGILGSRFTPTFSIPPPTPILIAVPGPIAVPSPIISAAPPASTVAGIVASQAQTAAAQTKTAEAGAAITAANVAAARATATVIQSAVATVPTFKEQAAAAATAVVTSPSQRIQVAEIVKQAQAVLATYQPSHTTDSGVVVTAKSPVMPDGGTSFGDLPAPRPIVPKLIAEKAALPTTAAPPGVAAGGAANAEGPSGGMVLALAAALALLFLVKV